MLQSKEAASALDEIDAISRKVRQSIVYQRASFSLILWGVLVFIGYLVTFFAPRHSFYAWIAVYVLGVAGSVAIGVFDRLEQVRKSFDWRLLSALLLFFGFGFLCTLTLGDFAPRALSAFWPIYFMLPFAIVGLWAARAFVFIGVSVMVLTLIGFFFAGPWFNLWMAFVNGGGLLLAGLWMRRA
ncbi:hypothetical protein [Methylocapsa sp. S129]|uniref:hypothetical protein n=1 Tax=Methylocapsa sp. S129 TaxID=1641869 RepID=UPI00131B813F|nr:hypothetical protein [Methylocapsa sp. S129]